MLVGYNVVMCGTHTPLPTGLNTGCRGVFECLGFLGGRGAVGADCGGLCVSVLECIVLWCVVLCVCVCVCVCVWCVLCCGLGLLFCVCRGSPNHPAMWGPFPDCPGGSIKLRVARAPLATPPAGGIGSNKR